MCICVLCSSALSVWSACLSSPWLSHVSTCSINEDYEVMSFWTHFKSNHLHDAFNKYSCLLEKCISKYMTNFFILIVWFCFSYYHTYYLCSYACSILSLSSQLLPCEVSWKQVNPCNMIDHCFAVISDWLIDSKNNIVLFYRSVLSSSGETVTSVSSSSPAMHRKERRHKPQLKDITEPLAPPQIPAKGT